jgi:hypothetical protein
MFRLFASTLVALVLLTPAFAESASGFVFDDTNANGKREASEAGIPGICVSNGREVVQSDNAGAWSLPVKDDTILFVIKPSGWAVPVSTDQVPRFYYIHKPKGSPKLSVPGVAPTGPLPASIDFPLVRREEPDRFDVVYFGDPQARGLREVNFVVHDVVEELIGTHPAFGVTLGDIVADDVGLFDELTEAIAQIGVPWYNVFGNHDNNRDGVGDRYSDETFERAFGPTAYAFEYGQVVFITLDNIVMRPEGGYDRYVTADQYAFVRAYLDTVPREKLVVLQMHVPIPGCSDEERILELLADRPHAFSISGHAHEQMHFFLDEWNGWKGVTPTHHHLVNATVSGSWWCGNIDELGIPHATMNDGGPNGYSVVTFDGTDYRIRFKAARRPADYQMNIYLPSEMTALELEEAELLVNVFAGSERSRVEVRWDQEGPWMPLEQVRTIDPEILRMHNLNDARNEEVFGWKMDYPSKTSHMWRGSLPALEPGTHTCTVRETDMFGEEHVDHRIVRVRAGE